MPQDNDKIESAQRTDAEVAETNNQNNANQVQTYERTENIVKEKKERVSSDTTIFRGALMITNLCFGVTIFIYFCNKSNIFWPCMVSSCRGYCRPCNLLESYSLCNCKFQK